MRSRNQLHRMTNGNNEKGVSNVQIGTPHKLAAQFSNANLNSSSLIIEVMLIIKTVTTG